MIGVPSWKVMRPENIGTQPTYLFIPLCEQVEALGNLGKVNCEKIMFITDFDSLGNGFT